MTIKNAVALMLAVIALTTASGGRADTSGRIVVMPVEAAGDSLNGGIAVVEEILADYFKDNRSVQMITGEQKESLAAEDTGNRLQIIRSVTAKMQSDTTLLFSLSRFHERDGDQYSVKDPASLAFEFKLVSALDGQVTCSGSFDETQKSLSENILDFPRAFKRGFKWLTGRELAREAIKEKFAACPALTSDSGN